MFKQFLDGASRFCMSPDDGGGAPPPAAPPAGGKPPATPPPAAPPAGGKPPAVPPGGKLPAPGAGDPPPSDGGDAPPPADGDEPPAADWRKAIAGEDAKALETLNRFASPAELFKSYQALRQKVSSGELKAPLPKDATPEQIAEHRKANGIPEKPEGYLEALPEGLVLGDSDKAAYAPFLKNMHDQNASPAVVQAAIATHQQAQAQMAQAIQEADATLMAKTEDTLRAEWQGDYRPNMAAVDNFLTTNFSAEVKAAILNSRDEKNQPLIHNADFLKACAQLGRTLAPAGATYGAGLDSLDTIDNEIKQINQFMRTNRKEYFADTKKQARLRELYAAKERFAKKAG